MSKTTTVAAALVGFLLVGAVPAGATAHPAAPVATRAHALAPPVEPAGPPGTALQQPAPAAGVAGAAADTVLTPVGAPFASATYDGRGGLNGGIVWSSPGVGDVTGDGRPDIVTSGFDGRVRVYDTRGTLVATGDTGPHAIYGSPAIGDVNGDGVADVTVGNQNNTIRSFSFTGGRTTVVFDRTEPARVIPGPNGFWATPALADLSGDGRLDVVASSWGQQLEAWSTVPGPAGAPLPGWPNWLLDSIWSSPAVGDVDADGSLDVVVGGDCAGSGPLQPCWGTSGGGYVWAFDRSGREKWKTFVPGQVVWSSPALVDLNKDGAQDVVVGTGLFWPDPAGRRLMAFDGRTGRQLWSSPAPGRVAGSPSVGDVDGDGSPELFVVSEGAGLTAYRADGRQMWSGCVDSFRVCRAGAGTFGGASLADVDGDGRIEALVMGEDRLHVFDAQTGRIERTVGSPVTAHVTFASSAPPSIVQIDGTTWVLQTALGDQNNNRQRDAGDSMMVLAWRSGHPLGAAPWPTFKGTMHRGGAVPLPVLDPAQHRRYVSALYLDLLGRPAGAGERDGWALAMTSRRLTRFQVADQLASSEEWTRNVVSKFYRDTLGREPDAAGLAGWVGSIRAGTPVADVAAAFYASQEYYQRVGGGAERPWVADLYRKLLLREASPAEVQHWVGLMRSGWTRQMVAATFYASPETLRVRINSLYVLLLGRQADPGGLQSWPPFLLASGDIALAAGLVTSQEYFERAQRR